MGSVQVHGGGSVRRRLTSVCSWRCRHSAYGLWPLLRCGFLSVVDNMPVAFVSMTPAFEWGAAETHNR